MSTTLASLAPAWASAQAGEGTDEPTAIDTREAFLWVRLGPADYVLPVADLLEIRHWEAPTPLADGPSAVRGVISVRGQILPVVDLRLRLALAGAEEDEVERFILVAQITGRTLGLIVDGVVDFLVLEAADILPPPAAGSAPHVEYMGGRVARAQRMLILIRLDRLLRGCGLID